LVEAEQVFTTYRPRLFGLAYRMLGSVMDAEDLVQEGYLRWQGTRGDGRGTTGLSDHHRRPRGRASQTGRPETTLAMWRGHRCSACRVALSTVCPM
jgi:hypothetical protein